MMHLPENDKGYQNKKKGNNEVVTDSLIFKHNLGLMVQLSLLTSFSTEDDHTFIDQSLILAGQRLTMTAASPLGP